MQLPDLDYTKLLLTKLRSNKIVITCLIFLGDLTFFEKVGASSFSGLVGALVGNPTDICLVRF
jgi:hypothetical protein